MSMHLIQAKWTGKHGFMVARMYVPFYLFSPYIQHGVHPLTQDGNVRINKLSNMRLSTSDEGLYARNRNSLRCTNARHLNDQRKFKIFLGMDSDREICI